MSKKRKPKPEIVREQVTAVAVLRDILVDGKNRPIPFVLWTRSASGGECLGVDQDDPSHLSAAHDFICDQIEARSPASRVGLDEVLADPKKRNLRVPRKPRFPPGHPIKRAKK